MTAVRTAIVAASIAWAASAQAQVIGTFRWQTAPFCNVVTLTVTQQPGGAFTLDGFDDQCGASTRASASRTAVPNPDGTIALGLTIVSAPEASPLHLTVPSGRAAVAMGLFTVANGTASVALGNRAVANADGSFFGDRSTNGNVESGLPNQFLVRAAGGTVFWSTFDTTFDTAPGVVLFHGESAWAAPSDVHAKEHFRDLDGDVVLAKLAQMPIREWSFKAHDGAIRHVGSTAQDLHAAFGLGQDERRIGTIDADGIALRAIQALEVRTRAQLDENRALRDEFAEIRQLLGAKR